MTLAAIALVCTIARGALEIGGSATCPSPADVQAVFTRRAGTLASTDRRAVLDEEGASSLPPAPRRLRLKLFDGAGELLGERMLPADADCHAMAETVAALLLSFTLDLGEAPPSEPPPALSVPLERPVRAGPTIEAGVGGFASVTSDGQAAASVLLLGSLALGDSPVQLEIEAQAETERQLGVGSGLANWERLWVAPGVEYRFLRGSVVWASAHLDVPVGAAVASGSNLAIDRGGAFFDLGISGGVRIGLARGILSRGTFGQGLVPWAGLWLIGWPLSREVTLSNAPTQAQLPQLEVLVGAGLSWSGG